ncbi:uncharacterized protein N7477_002591 [Penicillium maclennaniae]|uniref:uncharacterized protein n=1 Tax=Penicillium maclennaniae TaxID=1343394 RepID=UPI002540D51D|nr:uncharacterized protein N7477_002591 [Penicillium maclennaniae]KAJ5676958.1 hypothetical protein N7477_002591 [Penicillium maclennaniae]
MTVIAFPSGKESPDMMLLNVARLFTRLEHNLLSPGSELRTLRGSEFQRMRVTKNVEYARTLLSQLERSLPQLKQPDRRHEAQVEIARDRELLKRIQAVLDQEDARADNDAEVEDVEDDEWRDLFSQPVTEVVPVQAQSQIQLDRKPDQEIRESQLTTLPTTTTSQPAPTAPTIPSTLRNRHNQETPQDTAKATGRNTSPNKLKSNEQALASDRMEQEDLTSSLLSLASQLKASSHSFQATLENEKSILDRAVTGIDKTSTTMEAAGQRMGMLRKMSEGKGWWGRMMLYGWIFGLWLVAVLIVFIGPKLRF